MDFFSLYLCVFFFCAPLEEIGFARRKRAETFGPVIRFRPGPGRDWLLFFCPQLRQTDPIWEFGTGNVYKGKKLAEETNWLFSFRPTFFSLVGCNFRPWQWMKEHTHRGHASGANPIPKTQLFSSQWTNTTCTYTVNSMYSRLRLKEPPRYPPFLALISGVSYYPEGLFNKKSKLLQKVALIRGRIY